MDLEKDERTKIGELDIYQIRAITFIDQYFYMHGEIPTYDTVADQVGCIPNEVEKWFSSRQFNNALRQRGVDLSYKDDPENISHRQAIAAHAVFNTEDRESLNEKLSKLGVSMAEWQGWVAQPRFRQYIRSRALTMNEVTGTMALLELDRAVADGDRPSVELALKMQRLYNPRMDININIQSFVMTVVEVLQKHVDDPIILNAIAGDLEEATSKALDSGS